MKKASVVKSILLVAVFVFAAAMAISFQSCVKDKFDFDKMTETEYRPNVAVPLIYSSLTVQDLITKEDRNGIIVVGSDKFCTLVYKGNLFSLAATDLLKLPNQQQPAYAVNLTAAEAAALNSAGTVSTSYTQTVNFAPGINNPKIDSMKLKTGSIDVNLYSDFACSGQVKIVIPTAKKNGAVFSQVMPIVYTGTVPVLTSASFDLSGYTFDMTSGGTTYNQFAVNYDVTLTGTGANATTANLISVDQTLSNMAYSRLFGDIGQLALSPNLDTVGLSIFKNALGTGSFTLVDPSVKVTISNSYGVPIQASIAKLDGYTPPAASYPITGSPNPINIPYPTFSQIGQYVATSYTLNSSNSNIVSVINNTPKNVIYQINSLSNPAGATHQNFVTDSSRFLVDLEVYLPFWGTAKDYELRDTLDLTLDESISDNVESLLFRIYNSNGFPLDFNFQAYLTDSNYVMLDSLVIPNQPLMRSAAVSSVTGKVTSPTQTTYDMTVNDTRLKKLKDTGHVIIKAVAATTNNGATNVKIYSDYRLDVKLGTQIQFKTKF